MAFTKGQSGNPAGRKPGTKNKVGAELRQRIEEFLTGNFELIAADFAEMQPNERHRLFVALLPYCIGKKQDLSIDTQLGQLSDEQLTTILNSLESSPEDEP